jgi:hypothetical protein
MYTLKNYRELLNLCLRANGYGAERSDMTFEAPPSNNHFKELIELVGLSDKEAQEELLDILISVDRERLSEFLQNGNGRNIFPEIKTKLRELIDGR